MRNVSCLRRLLYTSRPDLFFDVEVMSMDMQRYKESCEIIMKIRATSRIPIVGDSNGNHRVDLDDGNNVASTEAARQAMWVRDLLEKIDITVSEKDDIRECVESELSEVEHKETREFIGVQDLSKMEFKLKGENVGLSLKEKRNLINNLGCKLPN